MAYLQTVAKGTFASAVGVGTVALGLLYYGQNYLIYPSSFPPGSRTEVTNPAEYGLPYEDLTLDTPDGIRIKAFLLVQRKYLPGDYVNDKPLKTEADVAEADRQFAGTRPTILMFHGNGGNIGHRIPIARVFYSKMRCNVLLLSYRGYGHSEGQSSEEGLKTDSQTALDFLLADPVLSRSPMILYGQSIGGAVAISLASRNPTTIKALILENTFLSVPQLIPTAIPWLSPFSWLCHQKWDSANAITKIPKTTPILMLSGVQDDIVPREHMVGLWDISIGKTKPSEKPTSNPSSSSSQPTPESTTKSEQGGGDQPSQPSTDDEDYSKEYVEYASVDGNQVMTSKRTKYRYWQEFENGTHNDTCVQPGYWAAVASFIQTLVPLNEDDLPKANANA